MTGKKLYEISVRADEAHQAAYRTHLVVAASESEARALLPEADILLVAVHPEPVAADGPGRIIGSTAHETLGEGGPDLFWTLIGKLGLDAVETGRPIGRGRLSDALDRCRACAWRAPCIAWLAHGRPRNGYDAFCPNAAFVNDLRRGESLRDTRSGAQRAR
ncbi:DUF6455 family protein [Oceanibacterium hippocampi]|uniref:DUF6455 domain-containing protein n=1 Tax=Oceanibacterium hippocampi TaxID=745714 RepID=A0A1Y5SSM2_9PROT|nr:DUF6455 family protein [Oceanibacterium hippocampi]SLN44234.1 hypothetical protein OCH7691_01860 [Oceanibacterium hippocampi]